MSYSVSIGSPIYPYVLLSLHISQNFSKSPQNVSICLKMSLLSNFEQFWADWAVLSSFEQFWAILSNFEQFWAGFLGSFEQFWAILSRVFGQFLMFFFACFKCKFCSTLWTHLNSFQVGSWQSQVLYWLQLLYWGFKFAVGMLSSSIMLQSEIVWYV